MLGTAGIIVPLLVRLGISSILGYLIVGILLGPDVIGNLAKIWPALDVMAFSTNADFTYLAELGVVFLLFLIGLELSLERLNTMKRFVFGLGGLQVLASLLIIAFAASAVGYTPRQSVILGMAFSLSSTAIVIQLLSDSKRLGTQAGRVSFAVLLMQDLTVIPMLMLVGLMSTNTEGSLFVGVLQALVQALAALLFIVLVGRYALRPILKMVAKSGNTDFFMAAVLFIAVGTGALATAVGLSMSLGAFIAGLMLAETEYRRAIEAIIEPFKGILLGAFFLLVGLSLDLGGLADSPLRIIGMALALVAVKSAIIFALARIFGVGPGSAFESAALLGPCGEFAIVILTAAVASGLMSLSETREPLLLVTLTMMAIPPIARMAQYFRKSMAQTPAPAQLVSPPSEISSHVIIAGFGRVGTLVASMLKEHNIPYIASDGDTAIVERERKNGQPVFFGDATSIEFLKKCGLQQAKALAITMNNPVRADDIVKIARAMRPDLKIIARARDEKHAMRLYESGATEAVPETVESSLQLGEALLVETGVPMGLAIASIHERRDGFRKLLGRPNRREQLKSARDRLKSRMPG